MLLVIQVLASVLSIICVAAAIMGFMEVDAIPYTVCGSHERLPHALAHDRPASQSASCCPKCDDSDHWEIVHPA